MSNVTGNTMTIAHIVDFYMLEAMRAGLTMAKSANSAMRFRRSVERLENDLEEAFNHMADSMALRLYVYIWGISLEEAMHSDSMCEYTIAQLRDFSISETFDYFPGPENINAVIDTFTQDWSSSAYGGNKWAQITDAMNLYGLVSSAAFVDHCVDLEHNTSSIFNKTGESPFLLDCFASCGMSYRNLHNFLDLKFSGNILQDKGYFDYLPVSTKVYTLLNRYNNVVESIKAVEFSRPWLKWLSSYTVNWNSFEDGTLDIEEARSGIVCYRCGDHVSEDEANYIDDEYYCPDCTHICQNCDSAVPNDATTYVDGISETWCDDCYHRYAYSCDECGTDYHTNNMLTTNDNALVCEDCFKRTECEVCGGHYVDMPAHDSEEHEDESDDEDSDDNKPGVYAPGWKTLDILYITSNGKWTVTDEVYEITPGLFLFNTGRWDGKTGEREAGAPHWTITTKFGYSIFSHHTNGSFHKCKQIAEFIAEKMPWDEFDSAEDAYKHPVTATLGDMVYAFVKNGLA